MARWCWTSRLKRHSSERPSPEKGKGKGWKIEHEQQLIFKRQVQHAGGLYHHGGNGAAHAGLQWHPHQIAALRKPDNEEMQRNYH
eukprot:7417227-Pyramimonas_sp.AAC.1